MQLIINILLTWGLYLFVGLSFSLIYYPAKFFHIAHAAIITFGAYFVFLFSYQLLLPFSVSVILAVILSCLLGMLCEILVYRRMRKNKVPLLSYLIASIGLYVVLQNIISLWFGDSIKTINTSAVSTGNSVFGAYITNIQITAFFAFIALFTIVELFLHFNAIGKSIRAVASNPELCDIYGISSNKTILISFGMGSALAAIAGIFSAMDTNMTPTFGFNILLYGVVTMIIGGVGSTKGLIAGSLLLATAQHLTAYYIDTKWMNGITYIILISFLIWKPLGFSGKRLKKLEV